MLFLRGLTYRVHDVVSDRTIGYVVLFLRELTYGVHDVVSEATDL